MINNKFSSVSSRHFFAKTSIALTALAAVILPAVTHADSITRYLGVGSKGNDVSSVQTFLATDPTLYPQGLVTGYYGFLTKAAVSNFQTRNGIDPVGRIGPATLPVINAQMASGMNNGIYTGTDRRSPTIGYVNVGVSSSAASFSWNTDEAAAALVYYSAYPIAFTEASAGSSITVSGTPVTANLNVQSSHSANISNLQPNTTYYYVVYVKDASGNESVTSTATFRTLN